MSDLCPATGKRSYESRPAARKALVAIKGRPSRGPGHAAGAKSLEVYRCDACRLFHLGRPRTVSKRAA